jgi:phosphonate transport system permease protein
MATSSTEASSTSLPSSSWALERAISPLTIGALLIAAVLMAFSAKNVELDKAVEQSWRAVMALAGYGESRVVNGASNFLGKSFPMQLSTRTETNRIENFDRENLPWLSYLEIQTERDYNAHTNTFTEVKSEYLVRPYGYLVKVAVKMWETIEMAFWGTVLSCLLAIPLSIGAAKNYTPHRAVYSVTRGICSFNRAMPELILALFFVLMYGFGPVAGILALGIHTSGFLGKFFADEIENADPGPQHALRSTGANRIKVLRIAVLPQVLPQYYAYLQYILERNIRTATVLGIVGAGGIGTELKGRWDLFDYDHVSTILLAIFLTVMILEWTTQRLRSRVI